MSQIIQLYHIEDNMKRKVLFLTFILFLQLRQYVVQTFCRNVDLAAKWNKKKNKPKEHYQKCKRSTTWKV